MNKVLNKIQQLSQQLKESQKLIRDRVKVINKQFALLVSLMVVLCLVTFRFTLTPTHKDETVPEGTVIATPDLTEPEVVHEDLGDEPVEPQTELSLDDVEKRVVAGELTATTRVMKKGDSLLSLLSEQNVPSNERMEIAEALELLMNLKSLRPGLTFLFFHEQNGTLAGMSVRPKETESLSVLREKDGSWVTFSQTGRIETKQERVQVVVERTFSGSAKKANLPNNVISQVTSAFDGEIDFTSNIHPGDIVDIILESKETPGGVEIGTKQVLYAGLKSKGKEFHRYAYNNAFYDARGRAPEKMLLKRPVKGHPRLSSPFGKRRHPILQYEIFHKGVDLAVPRNTPVQAAADGTVEIIGRKGSYGKYIRLGHKAGYQTAYAHLNGYRQDLKVGSKVKRGEVIAYVGTTGRSTGPHLHYEVLKNGKVVNPFGNNKIGSIQLTDFELEKFKSWAESINPDFKQQVAGKIPEIPPEKPF